MHLKAVFYNIACITYMCVCVCVFRQSITECKTVIQNGELRLVIYRPSNKHTTFKDVTRSLMEWDPGSHGANLYMCVLCSQTWQEPSIILTHYDINKTAVISQTIFPNTFSLRLFSSKYYWQYRQLAFFGVTCGSFVMYTRKHYSDVIMGAIASQITSPTIVYSTVYSDADQRKHQSSASLTFVWGINRDRWIPRPNGQWRGKCFHLMTSSWNQWAVVVYEIRPKVSFAYNLLHTCHNLEILHKAQQCHCTVLCNFPNDLPSGRDALGDRAFARFLSGCMGFGRKSYFQQLQAGSRRSSKLLQLMICQEL